jgi:hypothetical protein
VRPGFSFAEMQESPPALLVVVRGGRLGHLSGSARSARER